MTHSRAKCPQRWQAAAAVAFVGRLLADCTASGVAGRFGHGLEAHPFTLALALARVVLGFAVVHTFAGGHAVAVNGGVCRLYLGGHTREQRSSGHCEGGTSSSGFN